MTRTFRVVRDADITGISGTGVVAHGAQFPNITAVDALHGHCGATHLDWDHLMWECPTCRTPYPSRAAADACCQD